MPTPARRTPVARDQLESLSSQIYRAIRDDMLAGTIRAGQRITEADLAARFGTSKTPVKAALGRLVHEGLVEAHPRVGYGVTVMTAQEIDDVFEFRLILEAAAVELATARMTDADLDRLDSLAQPDRRSSQRLAYLDFFARNRAFHLDIARCSGNAYLLRALESIFDKVDQALLPRVHADQTLAGLELEHRNVMQALRRRDAARARQLTEASIRRMKQSVIQTARMK